MYGGSPENRARLVMEVLAAVVEEFGAGRVALRLSPTQPGAANYFGAEDSNEMDVEGLHLTYGHVIKEINKLPLAYLLLTEPRWFGGKQDNYVEKDPGFNMPITNSMIYRQHYRGVLIAAGGFVPHTAEQAVRDGTCDAVAFGRWFIANPDLPQRIREESLLNRYDRETFYTWGTKGYTDYPDLAGTVGITGRYNMFDPRRVSATPVARL